MLQAENMQVGLGAQGNFYLIEGSPRLNPGVGGHVYFDYRFAPHFSTQFNFGVSMQDGRDSDAGDTDILLLSMPNVAFKYYFLENSGRIDPFASVGVGLFLASEGTRSNGTKAFGFGANAGVGMDFYLGRNVSAFVATQFNSIGMIDSVGGDNGKGLFPLATTGGVGIHF
jgi:outer membrane protein W